MNLIDFIWKIKKFGFENVLRRFYSIYPAIVTDNLDEENRGRIKVEIPDLLDDKELVEWCEPILSTAGIDVNASESRTGGKYGSWLPPKIGDHVWVMFRLGDMRNPLYLQGGWWAKEEKPDFLSDDRKNAVFISRYGHEITVDETQDAAKINIQSNKNYQIEIDETLDNEKITIKNGITGTQIVLNDQKDNEQLLIELGKSKNKLQFFDKEGEEYILLEDKNGDSWKWDLNAQKWSILFKGEKEETIEKTLTQIVQETVTQTLNQSWNVTVSDSTTINSGSSAVIKQPQIAIGNGSIELLEQIIALIDKLATVRVITPVGPAAPMLAAAEWATVEAEKAKVQSIKGSF